MLIHTQRVHVISLVARRLAIGFAFVAFAFFSQLAQAQDNKPIDVFVTWLDNEAVILAFRSPAPSNRIVVGIARPKETEDSDPTHLYQVPGLKEAIPTQAELEAFRTALTKPGVSGKYVIHTPPMEAGATFSVADIDKRFRDYIHAKDNQASDFEVWDVQLSNSDPAIRIVFVGDLVLVKPDRTQSPHSVAENKMVLLLADLVRAEGKGIRDLILKSGCIDAPASIRSVQNYPLNAEQRKKLRGNVSGVIQGASSEENEYKVTNTGWVSHPIRLEIAPQPDLGFQVTSKIDDNREEEITSAATELKLPPCAVAQISVKPRRWYETFQQRVNFDYKEPRLKVEVFGTGLRWDLVGVGLFLLAIIVTISWLFIRNRPSKPSKSAREQLPIASYKDERNWIRRRFESLKSPKTAKPGEGTPLREAVVFHPDKLAKGTPEQTPEPSPAVDPLETAFQDYREVSAKERAASDHLSDLLNQRLLYFKSTGETLKHLDNLEAKFKDLQTTHESWTEALSELGDSPKAINTKVQTLRQAKQTLEGRILEIQGLLTEVDKYAQGAEVDIDQALDYMRQTVLDLKQSKDDYETAAMRILDVIDPVKLDMEMLKQPDRVASRVEQLRGLTDRVLQAYSEPLQIGPADQNLNLQSVADLEKRFQEVIKIFEALALLGGDERVHRARIVCKGLETASKNLRDLNAENGQYAELFVGTKIELGALAQELLVMAKSAELTLTTGLSRQVALASAGIPDRKEIDQILIPFFQHLLRNAPYRAILNMLRLWQVTEVYCRDSSDPVAATFFERSLGFRNACDRVRSDFKYLGVHFHHIRFLTDPKKEHLVFTGVTGVPLVQSNSKLIEPMLRKLNLDYRQYDQTIADVNAWGFECDLDPSLNCETKLWLWQPFSKGLTER